MENSERKAVGNEKEMRKEDEGTENNKLWKELIVPLPLM
jgi:hypothetical protein